MARPAAFVDRDGTVIVEREYLSDPAGVELIEGAAGALARLHNAGYALVMVTNQSGIARGLYDFNAYEAVQQRVEMLLNQEGVRLDAVYMCPHHPDFTGPCDCRKPGTALFERAAAEHDLDLRRSVFIGDRLSDVIPAEKLGGRAWLVRTGYGEAEAPRAGRGVRVARDLSEAAREVAGAGAREG